MSESFSDKKTCKMSSVHWRRWLCLWMWKCIVYVFIKKKK